MSLTSDDETITEQAQSQPIEAQETLSPSREADVPLESGMDTGQGADDEPELAIGDRSFEGNTPSIDRDEAERLLGDDSDDS